ncbi:MAG: hypothetical protein WCD79_06300, partial [Chthoniobacteraceae bacterium]
MKFFKTIRKQEGAMMIALRAVLFAVMASLVFAPMAVSAMSARCGDASKAIGSRSEDCRGCCPSTACCSMKKNEVPAKSQPLGTAREGSAQQPDGVVPPCLPVLHEVSPVVAQVYFFRADFQP